MPGENFSLIYIVDEIIKCKYSSKRFYLKLTIKKFLIMFSTDKIPILLFFFTYEYYHFLFSIKSIAYIMEEYILK